MLLWCGNMGVLPNDPCRKPTIHPANSHTPSTSVDPHVEKLLVLFFFMTITVYIAITIIIAIGITLTSTVTIRSLQHRLSFCSCPPQGPSSDPQEHPHIIPKLSSLCLHGCSVLQLPRLGHY